MSSASTGHRGFQQQSVFENVSNLLRSESAALSLLTHSLPGNTGDAVAAINNCGGRVVFTGMGKSGLIGKMLAATFSSVGIPSLFMHPAEALHGDLGMVQVQDLCIVLSKSAGGSELERVVPLLADRGIKTLLISCGEGMISGMVDTKVVLPLEAEADPYNLVPTSSVIIMLAFGHALGLAAALQRGFSPENFALVHPGGSLGIHLAGVLKK